MTRPPIAGMFNASIRVLRPLKSAGAMREEVTAWRIVGVIPCAMNRPAARLGDPGPGLTNVGERIIYANPNAPLRARDVLEVTAGPDVGTYWEVDETPTNVRGHHLEARARAYAGVTEPRTVA